jgi:hypothetical protein
MSDTEKTGQEKKVRTKSGDRDDGHVEKRYAATTVHIKCTSRHTGNS